VTPSIVGFSTDALTVSASPVSPSPVVVSPKKRPHPIKPLRVLRDVIKAKKAVKKMRKNSPPERSAHESVLIIIGAIGLVVGFIVLLLVNIGIGSLIGIIGLLFLVIGLASNSGSGTNAKYPNRQYEEQQEPKKEYQDVVYLKNGSIIRGMIIEQIPNKTLKIQTRDRSVFVYKYDEIEKITKELVE